MDTLISDILSTQHLYNVYMLLTHRKMSVICVKVSSVLQSFHTKGLQIPLSRHINCINWCFISILSKCSVNIVSSSQHQGSRVYSWSHSQECGPTATSGLRTPDVVTRPRVNLGPLTATSRLRTPDSHEWTQNPCCCADD